MVSYRRVYINNSAKSLLPLVLCGKKINNMPVILSVEDKHPQFGSNCFMTNRELFLRHVAQTSPAPLALEIVKADCCTLYDAAGNEYIDLIGGISVANVGHRHPKVIAAIQKQLDAYLHIMVYGEFIEAPQVQYAKLLTEYLPASLNSIYFTNSL